MDTEIINLSAYKYAESVAPELNKICSPLFKLNVKIFAYFRFFHDGRYLCLCNDLNWVLFCLQNIHNNEGTSLGQEIGHVPEENYHCFLWPTKKTDYLMSALYDFNIWNGLSIFKKNEDSIELWGFAADRQTENMQNFYVENIELLKDFTALFNSNASEFISPINNHLAIYKDFKPQIQFDEYNRSIPAVLKNAIDVGSRPYGQSMWNGKPGAIVSASPGAIGGFGANHHLRQSLVFLNVPCMQQPEAYIGDITKLLDEKGNLTNESTQKFFTQFMEAFSHWVEANKPA